MFRTKVVNKIKTLFLFSINCVSENRADFSDNVEKYGTDGQATDDNMVHAHCVLGK
jgi:hypothetical protein